MSRALAKEGRRKTRKIKVENAALRCLYEAVVTATIFTVRAFARDSATDGRHECYATLISPTHRRAPETGQHDQSCSNKVVGKNWKYERLRADIDHVLRDTEGKSGFGTSMYAPCAELNIRSLSCLVERIGTSQVIKMGVRRPEAMARKRATVDEGLRSRSSSGKSKKICAGPPAQGGGR